MKQLSNWRKEIRTIPNLLSLFRVVLLPFYLYLVAQHSFYLAGVIIAISGLTDFLDGFIARRFNQITELGKILDPVADKLTQLFLILSMAWQRPLIFLVLGLFIVKEGFMLVAGIVGLRHHVKLCKMVWKTSDRCYICRNGNFVALSSTNWQMGKLDIWCDHLLFVTIICIVYRYLPKIVKISR